MLASEVEIRGVKGDTYNFTFNLLRGLCGSKAGVPNLFDVFTVKIAAMGVVPSRCSYFLNKKFVNELHQHLHAH